MKIWFGLAAAASIASFAALFYLTGINGGPSLLQLFLEASMVLRSIYVVELVLLIAVIAAGLPRLRGSTANGPLLGGGAFVAPLFGLLGTAYIVAMLDHVAKKLGPARLDVIAPTIAEGVLSAALGFVIATVAVGFLVAGSPRPVTRAAR